MDVPRIAVIGVGNPDRGDDAAGRLVARCLRGLLPGNVTVGEHPGEGAGLLDLLEGADEALLIDAWKSGPEPGVIHRIDLSRDPLPEGLAGTSTHGFGLAEALELGQALGTLPKRCIVYAIAGSRFEIGVRPSAKVAETVTAVARQILSDLDAN